MTPFWEVTSLLKNQVLFEQFIKLYPDSPLHPHCIERTGSAVGYNCLVDGRRPIDWAAVGLHLFVPTFRRELHCSFASCFSSTYPSFSPSLATSCQPLAPSMRVTVVPGRAAVRQFHRAQPPQTHRRERMRPRHASISTPLTPAQHHELDRVRYEGSS